MENKNKLEDFKYVLPEENDNEDEYERALEKDIEANCDFSLYVNQLEIEEKSDLELVQMEKQDIIDFKNYQIQKLKAYIFSLEKEKEDLIDNFKNTTNVLLEKIKENEYKESGMRPETPFIAKKLKTNHKQTNIQIEEQKLYNDYNKNKISENIQRCANCTKEFPSDLFLQHSLDCLRNRFKCKKCNELIEEKFKKEHLLEWRSKDKVLQAFNKCDYKLLQKCLDHGLSPNKVIDEELGNTILHEVVKCGETKLLETLISTELEINPVNKNGETPLILAIEKENVKMAKFLIDMGADLKKRNNVDMSPLMLCCQKGLKELVHYLVLNKAEINEKSLTGVSPLSLCKDEDLSLFLIQSGARLSARPGSSSFKK